MRLTIQGRPVPAVRMTQRSKFVSKQAQRYLDYKTRIGWEAKAVGIQRVSGDVHVSAIAYIKCVPDIDVDNLGKSYLDGLNGVAWIDDKQVLKLTVEKRWVFDKSEERSEIEIREVS